MSVTAGTESQNPSPVNSVQGRVVATELSGDRRGTQHAPFTIGDCTLRGLTVQVLDDGCAVRRPRYSRRDAGATEGA